MLKFCKSLSKTLIITVSLATLLTTAVQAQSAQSATSKPNKGKGGIVITQPTLSEDQKAAAAVDTKIVSLPKLNKLTLTNEVAVNSANTAYNALTDLQKSLVKSSNKNTLTAAVNKLADLKKAAEVDILINALPKVDKLTVADTAAVNKAYAAFTALSKNQKALLTPSNSGKVTAAINKIASFKGDSLKALTELNSGKKSFSNFAKAGVVGAVEENNALYFAEITKTKATKGSALTLAEVQAIVDTVNKSVNAPKALIAINAGTEVFADFATAGIIGAVEGTKAAYDTAIADAKKIKASDLTLEEVQTIVNTKNQAMVDLKAAQIVINQIAALDNTKETYAADVTAAKEAYKILTDAQKALVTNYSTLASVV